MSLGFNTNHDKQSVAVVILSTATYSILRKQGNKQKAAWKYYSAIYQEPSFLPLMWTVKFAIILIYCDGRQMEKPSRCPIQNSGLMQNLIRRKKLIHTSETYHVTSIN